MATRDVPVQQLILVPGIVTLAITLLRLVGELQNWSPFLFSRAAGGAAALVGIVWLVPVFGVVFGLALTRQGMGPAAAGRAIGAAVLGFAVVPAAGFAAAAVGINQQSFPAFAIFIVFSAIGGVVAYRGWPALGQVLLGYGVAARLPVAIVMLFAIFGNWGTHYDVAPPNFPEMAPIAKWLLIGVLPQLTIWIWFTIAFGGIFGAITAAIAGRWRATD